MNAHSSPYQIVLTTIGSFEEAQNLAEQLLKRQLAACINILPKMHSIYVWQGEIERGEEHQLLIKTRIEQVAEVFEAIRAEHPYELPEILAVPIVSGFEPYLNWITQTVHTHDDN